MTRRADILLSAALALALAAPTQAADGFRIRASIGGTWSLADATSLDALLGFGERRTGYASLRVMWDKTLGPVRLRVHSQADLVAGDDVAYGAAIAPFLPAPPPATLLDLTQTWLASGDRRVTNTIDRLSLTYTAESFVLRAGRQAITWGSGTVFHPADILAPFAPNAVDTSYKTGADMVYFQYLFDSGADLQLIAVPRPAVAGGPVEYDSSTLALRARTDIDSLEATLMLARDRADTVASLGINGALGGATWNAEYVGWQLAGGDFAPSLLFNISNFTTIGGKNVAYFAEGYHNGFGVDSSVPLDALPAALGKRMATGQVFYAGTDFVAVGGQVQLTPDLTMSPTAIVSLNDHSALMGLQIDYTLSDSTSLAFAWFRPLGADGSEFGGRATSAGSGVFSGPGETATLRLVHFF